MVVRRPVAQPVEDGDVVEVMEGVEQTDLAECFSRSADDERSQVVVVVSPPMDHQVLRLPKILLDVRLSRWLVHHVSSRAHSIQPLALCFLNSHQGKKQKNQ